RRRRKRRPRPERGGRFVTCRFRTGRLQTCRHGGAGNETMSPTPGFRVDVLTLFPEIFQGYLGQSLLQLALAKGLVEIHLWNIRDWAAGRHRSVDDRPFGGGPGMVIMPGPVFDCVEAVRPLAPEPGELVLLTPAGRRLDQGLVRELAGKRRLL